jgi:hypothetical protein
VGDHLASRARKEAPGAVRSIGPTRTPGRRIPDGTARALRELAAPLTLSPSELLALQHSIGNAAVNRLLQRKVFVGKTSKAPLEFDAAKQSLVARFKYVPTDLLTTLKKWVTDGITDSRTFADVEALMEALKKVEREQRGLTPEEVDIVTEYTGGWYLQLNNAYRSKDKSWFQNEVNKKKVKAFLSGLSKTSTYKNDAPLSRVLTFETEQKLNEFIGTLPKDNGGIWVSPSALSSKRGADPLLALPAPKRSASGEVGSGKTYEFTLRLIAVGLHGADLSTMIREGAKSEQEVLFPPGTRFKREDDRLLRSTGSMQLRELPDMDKEVENLINQV